MPVCSVRNDTKTIVLPALVNQPANNRHIAGRAGVGFQVKHSHWTRGSRVHNLLQQQRLVSQSKVKGKGFLHNSKLIAEQVVVVLALHKGYLRLTNLLPLAFYFKTEPKGNCQKKED